jgi:hypothetical protein
MNLKLKRVSCLNHIDDDRCLLSIGGMMADKRKLKYFEKTSFSASLSTRNLTWTALLSAELVAT